MSSKEQAHNDNRSLARYQAVRPETQSAEIEDSRVAPARATQKAGATPWLLTSGDMIQLQRHLGNRFVNRLMAQRANSRPASQARPTVASAEDGLDSVQLQPKPQSHFQRPLVVSRMSPSSVIIQRVATPPLSITLTVEDKSGKVLKVEDDKGGEIPFVILGQHEGKFKEGTIVLSMSGNKLSSARFATVDTEQSELVSMPKVKANPSKVVAMKSITIESPKKEKEEEKVAEFFLKISKKGGLVNEKFTGFEKTHEGDQGKIHYEKHGGEFEASDKGEYIRLAKKFGETGGEEFCEAIINNTLIKVDNEGMKVRRVFIANGKKMRTFYVWDPSFSSDPFAYAIYYTITHNMGIPLKKVSPEILKELKTQDIDIFAIEREVITNMLLDGVPPKDIHKNTLAPMDVITWIYENDEVLKMALAFSTPKKVSKPIEENVE